MCGHSVVLKSNFISDIAFMFVLLKKESIYACAFLLFEFVCILF